MLKGFLIFFIPCILLSVHWSRGDDTTGVRPVARPYTPSTLYFPSIPPRVAEFSDNNATADSYANLNWLTFDLAERGQIILEIAETLINAHGFTYGPRNLGHSPRIITCKTYRESTFHSQIGNDNSSAVGLTQILDGTMEDMFDRYGHRLRSQVPGFEGVRDGAAVPQAQGMHHRMAASIPAQIEMGLFVMQMKAWDAEARGVSITSVRGLLENYFGATRVVDGVRVPDRAANQAYSNAIFRCAQCLERDNNDVSQGCLDCAKGLRSCSL